MDRFNQLINLLRDSLRISLSISFGVFLFLLFFQPFSVDRFDFNNWLVFKAGIGIIVFIFTISSRVVSLWSNKNNSLNKEIPAFTFINGFSLFALNSVAFAFYLYYVGSVEITFDLMLKIVLICLVPTIALKLHDLYVELYEENQTLFKENQEMKKQIEKFESDYLNKSIELLSETGKESLNILASQLAFLKSADNYVEVVYNEDNLYNKKLLRNTLKNIEQQIKAHSNFIRCHRTYIVNIYYIEELNGDYNKNWLTIKGYDEHIPVSRQYLYKLKETI